MTGNGTFEAEVQMRIQVGVNMWRRGEGIMAARKISRKLKGKVLMSCVTLDYLSGLETVALKERHQQRLQVCEKNWVSRSEEGG